MSKIKNGGLDQYGAELFEEQQFGPAGIEGVKLYSDDGHCIHCTLDVYLDVISKRTSQKHNNRNTLTCQVDAVQLPYLNT